MAQSASNPAGVLGWREWVTLPDLGVGIVKAKVDTGARSSSLHALEIEHFERAGLQWVRFRILPWQRSDLDPIHTEAALKTTRDVRSSSGESQVRPVIATAVGIGSEMHIIELTLTDRSEMGFRMLLGREAIRGRHFVDASRSYRTGKPPKAIRRRNRAEAEPAPSR